MKVDKKKLIKAVIKHKGNKRRAAKELRITPQSVSRRINNNPEIKQTIQDACRIGLAEVGADAKKIFTRTAEGLDAVSYINWGKKKIPNFKERRESAKLCHQLLGNLQESEPGQGGGPTIVMPVITIQGVALLFKVGTND